MTTHELRAGLIAAPLIAALLGLSEPAGAADIDEYADEDDKTLETCLRVALEVVGGQALNVEYKMEEGDPIYDFDVRADDGITWEIECNAENGMVWEIEREVAKDSALFQQRAELGEDAAVKTALSVFPGTVESVEYGIEADGTAVYEVDIVLAGGGEINVEVDAETGAILEANPELWEIGAD